jgi:hypothetical protein
MTSASQPGLLIDNCDEKGEAPCTQH